MNKKHQEYQRKLKDAEVVERENKELQEALDHAEQAKEDALKEKDEVMAGVLTARTEKEKEILRVFKRASNSILELDSDPKKPHEPKSEFLPNGLKTVPASYEGMDLTDVLSIASVDSAIREKIGQDEFVELKDLQGAEVQMVQHEFAAQSKTDGKQCYFTVHSAPRNQDPKTHPQFFHALYSWAQFYLQCYPQKTAQIFEYLLFMSKYGVIYSVSNLLMLDGKIRKFFTQNPELPWDMAGKQVAMFIRQADLELILNGYQNPNPQFAQAKGKQRQQSKQRSQSWDNSGPWSQGGPNRDGHNQSGSFQGQGQHYSQRKRECDPVKGNRCKNYNFHECFDRSCRHEHVCYTCSSRNHRGFDCPQYRNYGR